MLGPGCVVPTISATTAPSDSLPFRPFHAPCAGGFVGTRSRFPWCRPWPSPTLQWLGSPLPRSGGGLCDDAAGLASCCGPVGCSTPLRTRPLGRARGLPYRGPWPLPGPDSHRLAAVSLSPGYAVFLLLSLWRPNCWTHEGRRNSDSRPDQAIPKHRPDRRPALWSEITFASFSPDNVHETGVLPDAQSRSPIVAAEAERVERTQRKTCSRAESEFLCPSGPPAHGARSVVPPPLA